MNAPAPVVSIVMANYNAGPHIAAAVRSALKQTLSEIEIILSDDGSTDDSLASARAAAAGDPRLIVLEGGRNSGPGAARNRALAIARGDWIAILDSDDYMHPARLERLLQSAAADQADIVADDMLVFYQAGAPTPHGHAAGALTHGPSWITATAYADANRLFGDTPALGYLKPVFRRIGPDGAPARYDESLRIAEDYDLVMRLLVAGARMRFYPELGYFYRKHSSSISHRLSAADIESMLAAHDRAQTDDPDLQRALGRRRATLLDARAFDVMVNALKARRPDAALRASLARPSALTLFRYPIRDRLARVRQAPAPADSAPQAVLLTRRAASWPNAKTIAIPAGLSERETALHIARRAAPGASVIYYDDPGLAPFAPYVLSPTATVAAVP